MRLILLVLVFVHAFFTGEDSTKVNTQIVKFEYSFSLETQMAHLGLVDITKLSDELQVEIENMEIVRYAEIPDPSINGQIILVDVNKNGKFEYDSVDLVGLTSFKDEFRLLTVNFTRIKSPIVINVNTENYELLISESGEVIELVKTQESAFDLTFPYSLPTVEIKPLTKSAVLNKTNGKFTYVEFWGTWCKPCLQIVPEIKQLKEEFVDQLNIVGVNYKDKDMNRVKHVILQKGMNWDHIVANDQLMKEFGNPGFFPCGILFDAKGDLVKYGIQPDEVRNILSKN